MSLARRHRQRILAATASRQVAATGGVRTGAAATEYELIRARLGVDLRRLSEIQSIERKIELKRELLPEYDAWVAGVLEGGSGVPDDIVTHCMIWRIDVGDFDRALDLAEYVMRHRLNLPERFDRTAATLIAEEIADAAIKAFGQDDADAIAPFAGDLLDRVAVLVEGEDIFDQVRAKLEKALGLAAAHTAAAIDAGGDGPAGGKRAAVESALQHFRRALALDDSVGVKKRIEQLDREAKKLANPEA